MIMNKTVRSDLWKRFRFSISALTLGLFLLFPALLPEKASACACCANDGQWFEYKKALDENDNDALNGAKLSAKLRMYESAAEDEGIAVASSDFTLKLSRAPSRWTMALQGKEGEKGTLVLTLPATVTIFGADPRDGKVSNGGGPLLYKEVRLEGRVRGTGVFAKSLRPDSRFRLVLQGRGNACMLAQDFNNWVLQIYGRQARFGFYGTFEKTPAR
jgi:hypothetical protein